jgi:hypothetical protein
MTMLAARDDRDRRVRAYRLGVLEATFPSWAARRGRVSKPEVFSRAVHQLNRDVRVWAASFCIGLIPPALALALGALIQVLNVPYKGAVAWSSAVLFGALTVGIVVGVRLSPRMGWISWRRTMLEGRCCPSCGYRLTDLVPEPDGCTVCPECGSAWRIAVHQR